jgi:NitT/TauT family transport system substrate-binding protein
MEKMKLPFAGVAAVTAICAAFSAHAADRVTLQLGWTPGGDRAQFYAAKEGGFFNKEGLDVQILSGRGSADAMTKVATGNADFAEAGLDALLAARGNSDVPLVAVMSLINVPPDELLTTTAAGINTLKDLVGKKVGTSPFTSSNGPWPFLLRANGVDPSSVSLLKADPATLMPMLVSGQVDAIIQFVNNAPTATGILAKAGKTLHLVQWSDYGLQGYATSVVVSKHTLDTRRDLVVRFVRALKGGMEVMKADPAKAAAAVKASVPEMDLAIAEQMAKATAPLMFNPNTARDGFGIFNPELVKTTWEWVSKAQNFPVDKLDPLQSVDLLIAK